MNFIMQVTPERALGSSYRAVLVDGEDESRIEASVFAYEEGRRATGALGKQYVIEERLRSLYPETDIQPRVLGNGLIRRVRGAVTAEDDRHEDKTGFRETINRARGRGKS
jgi:hypothetical protein